LKIQTIIVDDEPLARKFLREMLRDDPDVDIVAECGSGYEAIRAVKKLKPDLLFLDIQMPELDGFGVLQALELEHVPLVIFVTAYDQYAMRAFEVHALDYLLKPFDDHKFERAMVRAKAQIRGRENKRTDENMLGLLRDLKGRSSYVERIPVKSSDRIILLRTEKIDWIESDDNYVKIHSGKSSHQVRETITNLERQLNPAKFLRIHRSTIVNIESIEALQPSLNGEYRVILNNGAQLTLSRRYRDKARQVLGVL
jgi:two-component system LytT family response regulator